MKGNPKVIEQLNLTLKEELLAINQYFLHAEMCENWGYEKLAEHTRKESIEERTQAEKSWEHILYCDGTPSMPNTFRLPLCPNSTDRLKTTPHEDSAPVTHHTPS